MTRTNLYKRTSTRPLSRPNALAANTRLKLEVWSLIGARPKGSSEALSKDVTLLAGELFSKLPQLWSKP